VLLIDHNLSYKLINDQELNRIFPGLQHIYLLGMYNEKDEVIWDYANEHNLIIVTKDYDFQRLHLAKGSPPYVVKISLGNCTNESIKETLLNYEQEIKGLPNNQFGLLVIQE
jgi:predicted nuclease of predicted toxin-antitoxin system